MTPHKNATQTILVGTYTRAGGKGIYPMALDLSDGTLQPSGDPLGLENPSWLTSLPGEKLIFAASEVGEFKGKPGGGISSVAWQEDDTGNIKFTVVDQTSSIGMGPCHLLADGENHRLVAANYGSGSAFICGFDDQGRFLRDAQGQTIGHFLQNEGQGTNPARQEGPHMHFAGESPDGQGVLFCDLGLDVIQFYRGLDLDLTQTDRLPRPAWAMSTPPGSGPRHLDYHPNRRWLYAVCELSNQVIVYRFTANGLETVQTVATLPEDFSGKSTTAAIRVTSDGRFLLVSNRGHDSLAIFQIDAATGKLSQRRHADCGGKTPRDLVVVDASKTQSYILVANQDSDNVSVLPFDRVRGDVLTPIRQTKFPAPVRVMPL